MSTPLQRRLQRVQRRQKLRALGLVAPLLVFVLVFFLWPIGAMLLRSVENHIVADTLPRTVAVLQGWSVDDEPPQAVYGAFLQDMTAAVETRQHNRLGSRLNYEASGMSSLFRRAGRAIARLDPAEVEAPAANQETTPRAILTAIDPRWSDAGTWAVIKTHAPRLTDGYFLNALDLRRAPQGIEKQPEERRIMLTLFLRTIVMSLAITVACVLLGYPLAWMLAGLPPRRSNLLMMLVLLPFWTSLLVRTSAWKVMLQQQGVVNDILVWLGLVADDGRLTMINNQFGTIIAMTHILLPFMILPMYSVMKTIRYDYIRAARSLGANAFTAFRRVYFPQSAPGIGAGSLLVFILAIGYYITPEIVGGTSGVFISNRIAYHISTSLNWGLAAALGALLLLAVLVLYWVYDRMVGIDGVKLG